MARHGSFSAAAVELGYTQPAISRQIATLEAEVGTVLVRRVPLGAVLTDAGRLLVARSEAILARLADAEAELRALGGLESGHAARRDVRVGGRVGGPDRGRAVPRALPRDRAQHRDCRPRRVGAAPARR